ncbi:MAG: hypothetical protein KY457_11070 [Actinobacteria bacterium]|nr:hypothetical protein [Actinomycetota bacterium]
MKQTERDAIEQLAQLLDGVLPADATDAPVRRLATLATTVTGCETVERPSAAVRASLRTQLVADIEASKVTPIDRVRDAVWDRTAGVRNSARAAVASAVAAGMLGSAGVAAAAQQAVPGDALYGVKRATESVRLSLASGLREEASVHLRLAEERLEELEDGAHRMSVDETVDTLQRMDASSVAASDTLIQAVLDGEDAGVLAELVRFTERQRAGIIGLYDVLPAAAKPFVDASLDVLRRIDVDVAATMGPCGVCDQIASGADVTAVTPGDGVDALTCDCLGPTAPPPPPREQGVMAPSDPSAAPVDGTADDEPAPTGSTGTTPDLVPPLPGRLDDLGDAVDDVIGGIDGLSDSTTGTFDDVTPLPVVPGAEGGNDVDDLGGLLETELP